MKKSKKIYIVIGILVIASIACITANVIRINRNKNIEIIDIDCKGDNCEKTNSNEVNNDKETNKDDNNKTSTDNKNNIPSNNTSNGTGTLVEDDNGTIPINGSGSGSSSNSGTGSSGNSSSSNESTQIPVTAGSLEVKDNNTSWNQNTNIKIFDTDKVAPGDSGSYDFMVNNNTNKNVIYRINFEEDNLYNANMMYKLKRNNEYVAGSDNEWVYYNNLNLNEKVLNSKYKDLYTIEWRWVDSDHDTPAGIAKDATYKLGVQVNAFETTEKDTSGKGSFIGNNPQTGDLIFYYIELQIISVLIILIIVLNRKKKGDYESL